MGVLIEALNVIVRVEVLEDKFVGGMKRYEAMCPNHTFVSDGFLTRIGFMAPQDVGAFVQRLEDEGLEFFDGKEFVDIAVVDQFVGPTALCSWLQSGRHPAGFSVAWLDGTSPTPMSAPPGWDVSQSKKLKFVPNEEVRDRVLPLLSDGSVNVVLDYQTGKQLHIGRTSTAPLFDLGSEEDS